MHAIIAAKWLVVAREGAGTDPQSTGDQATPMYLGLMTPFYNAMVVYSQKS